MDKIFQIESLDMFQNVAQEILSNLYYSSQNTNSTHIDAKDIETAKQDLIYMISDCNFDTQKITEVISNKPWQEEKKEHFITLLRNKKSDMLYAAFNHYNSNYCETVVNYDWLVKYVVGTSELKTLKFPLLQLTLSTLNKNGEQNKTMYDINKNTLLKMINVLENILVE